MITVGVVGPGLVGAAFIEQLCGQLKHSLPLRQRLRLVGIANSKTMLLGDYQSDELSQSGEWQQRLQQSAVPASLDTFGEFLAKSPYVPVLVDCTASSHLAERYPMWLQQNITIITPNKKAFSGEHALYDQIMALARQDKVPRVFYESTVGAGLPVVRTLQDLVNTGDQVTRIEGIFSGTLSFLFNTFSQPQASSGPQTSFSSIVTLAQQNGFTEPDPRDDLNGLDVARKVVILARLIGLPLTLETLKVENIVPEPLRALQTPQAFLQQLPAFDEHFAALHRQAQQQNAVLRYVGVIDPQHGCAVELRSFPPGHPFVALKGSDNCVTFITKRFPKGLTLQGAGAGAEVTAFGIFADLLHFASM